MRIKNKAKLIKGILSGFWWTIICLLAVCIVYILGAKIKGKVPQMFGYSVLHIVSGSMETEIPEGSYILIKRCDPNTIQQEDIICFYSDDPQIYGMPNTHRVLKRVEDEEGLRFITKGDANPTEDKVAARADRVIGKYVKKLDGITSLSNFLAGKGTLVILIVMQATACVFAVYVFLSKKKEQECEQAESGVSEESVLEDTTQNQERDIPKGQ